MNAISNKMSPQTYRKMKREQWKTMDSYNADVRFKEKTEINERISKNFVESVVCTCGKKFKRVKHSAMSHCSKRCYVESLEG